MKALELRLLFLRKIFANKHLYLVIIEKSYILPYLFCLNVMTKKMDIVEMTKKKLNFCKKITAITVSLIKFEKRINIIGSGARYFVFLFLLW